MKFTDAVSRISLLLLACIIAVIAASTLLNAQVRTANGLGIYPPSSIERPEDVGVRMHTNYIIYAPGEPTDPGG